MANNTPKTWIQIDTKTVEGIFPTDTPEEIEEARAQLLAAGLGQAKVHVGDPDSPDSYENGQVLIASGTSKSLR
jgi:hypothetical protein